MNIEKVGRKWIVKGEGDGWIYKKTFPTKWKAEVAMEVFKDGGRISDYWTKQREVNSKRPNRKPWRVLEKVKKSLKRLEELDPSCEEIKEYAQLAGDDEITDTDSENKFGPRLHDTWCVKRGGRVHIDIGCCGYHLMLNKNNAEAFIRFIEDKRKK